MKQIPGFENYSITKNGQVINTTTGIKRKLDFNKSVGYYQIDLWKNNTRSKFYIHRLVATFFIDNPNNFPEVNHIDADRTNNTVDNLEWVTSSGNSLHTVAIGNRDHVARMQEDSIITAYDLVMKGHSYKEVSELLDNSWKAGFLSVKVGRYADSIGTRHLLREELKRQRIIRSMKNLEAINNK